MSTPKFDQLSAAVMSDGSAGEWTICSLCFSPSNSSVVAAANADGRVALFDVNDNSKSRPLASWTAHEDSINACRFLKNVADGIFLATVSDDSTLAVWNARAIIEQQGQGQQEESSSSSGLVVRLKTPSEANCIAESSDGNTLYVGLEDGSVIVFAMDQAVKQQQQEGENNNNNNNNRDIVKDRFTVGEGAVNDLCLAQTPYGDLLFSVVDDGCVRCWRTFEGQKAPNEPSRPSNEEIERHISASSGGMSGSGNSGEGQGGEGEEEEQEGNQHQQSMMGMPTSSSDEIGLRAWISESLGSAAADRMLTSFDMLQGSPTNHLVQFTLSGKPHFLIAAANTVFAVEFDLDTGCFAEEPSAFFQGHNDYVRGIHPFPSSKENGNGFITVGDDGVVCSFSTPSAASSSSSNSELTSPVAPNAKFQGETLNLMASAMIEIKNQSAEEGEGESNNGPTMKLVTGCLSGSVRSWDL